MANRLNLWIAILFTAFMTINSSMTAKSLPRQAAAEEDISGSELATGILTDRLSRSQLRAWDSIRHMVFEKDKSGQLLHPTLHDLWQKVQSSGHAIYIELPGADQIQSCEAGRLRVEKFDSQGKRHVAVLRLHRSIIERANVGKQWQRADGFMPFQGLSRERRYVEVLGHELAHALLTLGQLKYAENCQVLYTETERLLSRGNAAREFSSPETRQRLNKLQQLMDELEKPAETTEREIWRELLRSQEKR
jgi:hypothetical protein